MSNSVDRDETAHYPSIWIYAVYKHLREDQNIGYLQQVLAEYS